MMLTLEHAACGRGTPMFRRAYAAQPSLRESAAEPR